MGLRLQRARCQGGFRAAKPAGGTRRLGKRTVSMTVLRKMRTDELAPRKARMLIGGKWVDSASGKVFEVEDPAHRRPIAEVPRGGAEDVARAVQAAADAFPAWSRSEEHTSELQSLR